MRGEVDDCLLQLVGRHLSMPHHSAGVGHQTEHPALKVEQLLDAVVYNKHLSATRQLKIDCLAQYFVIEGSDIGYNRIAVARRRVDGAEVARAHQ